MISPIGINEVLYHNYKKQVNSNDIKSNAYNRNAEYPAYNPKLLKDYFIPFTGKRPMKMEYDNDALELIDKTSTLAKNFNSPEINYYHILYSFADDVIKYINDLNAGTAYLSEINLNPATEYLTSAFDVSLLEDQTLRKKTFDYFNGLKGQLTETLANNNTNETLNKNREANSTLPKQIINDIISFKDFQDNVEMTSNSLVSYSDIYEAMMSTTTKPYLSTIMDFAFNVNNIYMVTDNNNKRLQFNSYATKADEAMRMLERNTNVFLTYDEQKVIPSYMIPSIKKSFESGNYKFKPENTEFIEYNNKINSSQVINSVYKFEKEKDKNFILVINQSALDNNSSDPENVEMSRRDEFIKILKKTPKNVHIILYDTNDNFLRGAEHKEKEYRDFVEIMIPVLNTEDVSRAIFEQKGYLAPKFTNESVEKIVTLSTQIDGILPDKTIDLIRSINNYYQDKDKISPDDIEKYINERRISLGKTSADSLEMLPDTGKRLKDIVGKDNTKKEAENIVKRIKNGTIGTKGFIIYSEDGSVGGGRKHTAKAIAGEAGIPYFAMNTLDFGTKDVNIFSESSLTPEASVKKLFSLVTDQAESNPYKSAELFIENFEYFSTGEMVSEYHQKAMAQLIREMNNAAERGFNIVVIGSVNDPEMMGEAISKSFKFNDTIEVSSPAYTEEARRDVLKHAFKDIKIEGNTSEQENLLSSMAKTLEGFSFIKIKDFAQKADTVAKERNNKCVTKSDMVEAYLRLTTGRPNLSAIFTHEKEIVTKHECGHAVTLQVMHDLMKKINKPWLIPDTVNFITLDPRGWYGGAMYPRQGNNTEKSFENNFSDIVCSYGGHSAEKRFYEMDGSWGISADLSMATKRAQLMTKVMGQGANTGKISLMHTDESTLTEDMQRKIEKDIDVITRNALMVSDMIVEEYSDFIDKFADKYASKVGTGECLIDGDTFREELKEWTNKQPQEKKSQLEQMEQRISEIIAAAKRGEIYKASSQNPLYNFNNTISF